MILDNWQQRVLDTKRNICVRAGRQVGKSTIISRKAAIFAAENPNKNILVVASVERQAYLLFEKILAYLYENYKKLISKGKDKPTKHIICLINGSKIYCLPTGLTGYGIRGYTIDLLIADEAAFIPEDVWTAVTPMLAITKGDIWLLSTPHVKEGYYFRCFKDESFTKFHISSEECPRKNEEFLKREKERMTKSEYAREYLGEFADELMQFFSDEIIKSCMTSEELKPPSNYDKFLGCDIARLGEDESVLISVERIEKENLQMIDMEISRKTLLTETSLRIKEKDKRYNYKKIYIDTGGLGMGVFDFLLNEEQTRRKVVSIENASRALDKDEKRRKKLLKEDLYTNLLRLMEQRKIKLFESPELFLSLKSIRFEYNDDKTIKIWGNYSHCAEALIRAAWCIRDKSLNIYIY